ncbi:Histidine kinase-, DNA gyrase B-, and HSP90-like ATPase [Daejeonella rubra]|uniref:histidine kinase n=1 Tax=Daejeonella rubra TaxID=990371 RepID=A0A1G9Q7H1_9SPHI|nr:tetratricopeptide repeat-containing sensor histidine kinase [Daejeonella rubra]SDM06890.1 Histidine kinase-, DNA gyrase B-, and HSP90-like ATPase [Daejeonella rubra]
MKLSSIPLFFIVFCCACSNKPSPEKNNNPYYKSAYKHRDEGRKDSAFLYFSKARDQFIQEKDSLKAAGCMVNMAIIATDQGDLFGGQELSLNAVSYFDEKNPEQHPYILSNYNNLGIASSNLKQYSKAIEFYNKSLEFIADSSYMLIVKNNIANAHRKNEDFSTALAIYKTILIQEKNPVNYARVLSNYAFTKWLENPNHNSAKELNEALNIRVEQKDLWGQNASYAHLADYYKKKRPDSALFHAKKMYQIASNLNSADDRMEAIQKLIPLSDVQDARIYFDQYRILEDSIQNARNNAKNQFALIRYETEKHKADNLILKAQRTVRNLWIISLTILLVAGGVFSVFWYKRRKKRLELSAKNAIQEGQLKTSKKVHDVVANGIYRIMAEIENNKEIEHEKILDEMEILYERSRDISYDDVIKEEKKRNFQEIIRQLLVSFASVETKVLIVGNTDEVWENLPEQEKYELKQVLQELMVNMRKHSQASSVAIRFERKANEIRIYYTDNGIGISEGILFKNGLTNTGNRINSIGGNINFGTGTTGGLNIQLQIPVKI